MISIHFQKQIDCDILFKQLQLYFDKYIELGLKGRVERKDQHVITIYYDSKEINFYESFQPLLVNLFTKHVISFKEEEWLLDIIESMFYFKDYEEQLQILSIARAIMEGDHEGLPKMKNRRCREESMYSAFSTFLVEESSFNYESFIKFRLKNYFELLVSTVEIAIDEYMLEQEYQHMVENFRFYINNNRPIFQQLHVVFDEKYYIYNEQYKLLHPSEIENLLNDDLKFEEGVSIEQSIISPLVSLAPEKLYIYTEDIDQGVIQTLQCIFQERVNLLRKSEFIVPYIEKLSQ